MVMRKNGFGPVYQLRDEVDRLVGDFFGPATSRLPNRWTATRGFPPLNVWEEGDTLYVEAEVPGVKSEDIDISVVGGDLTIRGQRRASPAEGFTSHRQERGTGEFARVVRLNVDVDAGKVEATLNDGVLFVKLPKAESAKPKKIQVKPAS
jgi:HSP20 family protein